MPRRPFILGAPDPGALPFAAAAGPENARRRVADDVIDRPAVAEGTPDGPVLPVTAAADQKGTLRGADQYRDRVLAHR